MTGIFALLCSLGLEALVHQICRMSLVGGGMKSQSTSPQSSLGVVDS